MSFLEVARRSARPAKFQPQILYSPASPAAEFIDDLIGIRRRPAAPCRQLARLSTLDRTAEELVCLRGWEWEDAAGPQPVRPFPVDGVIPRQPHRQQSLHHGLGRLAVYDVGARAFQAAKVDAQEA